MTTRDSTTPKSQLHEFCLVVEWAGLLTGDDAAWRLLGHYNDKCIHVFGTFGGATVTLQGSNEDVPSAPNSVPLTDPTQTLISFTSVGMKQVLENPLYIRPLINGGDGTTNLTARLVCRT